MLLDIARSFRDGLGGPRYRDGVALAEAAGLTLDPYQAIVVRSSAPQIILNVHRQGGKTFACAVKALHTARESPGRTILAVSPSQRQSAELVRAVRTLMNRLRLADVQQESVLSVTLANRSRILALPGDERTIRTYAAHLVLCDEAARIPDATLDAVRPMVSVTGGQLIYLSTPWGQRGRFYEAWTSPGEDWERVLVTALDCPRITAEFLARERRTLPPLAYESDYLCQFSDTVTAVFPTETVLAALDPTVKAIRLIA
jgi:hypothetical protein